MKYVFSLLIILSSAYDGFAQKQMPGIAEPIIEAVFGVGFLPFHEITLARGHGFHINAPERITDGSSSDYDIHVRSKGNYSGGIKAYISSLWRVGLHGFYGDFDIVNTYSNGNTFIYSNRYIGGLVRADYRWFENREFEIYSSAAIGVSTVQSFSSDGIRENAVEFGFQFSPIGARYGETIGIFAELGFGNSGMVWGGLSYKF